MRVDKMKPEHFELSAYGMIKVREDVVVDRPGCRLTDKVIEVERGITKGNPQLRFGLSEQLRKFVKG